MIMMWLFLYVQDWWINIERWKSHKEDKKERNNIQKRNTNKCTKRYVGKKVLCFWLSCVHCVQFSELLHEKKGVYMHFGHTVELFNGSRRIFCVKQRMHNIGKRIWQITVVCVWVCVCVYGIKCNVRAFRLSEPCNFLVNFVTQINFFRQLHEGICARAVCVMLCVRAWDPFCFHLPVPAWAYDR